MKLIDYNGDSFIDKGFEKQSIYMNDSLLIDGYDVWKNGKIEKDSYKKYLPSIKNGTLKKYNYHKEFLDIDYNNYHRKTDFSTKDYKITKKGEDFYLYIKNVSIKIPIRNTGFPMHWYNFKSYDITGDNKPELFFIVTYVDDTLHYDNQLVSYSVYEVKR